MSRPRFIHSRLHSMYKRVSLKEWTWIASQGSGITTASGLIKNQVRDSRSERLRYCISRPLDHLFSEPVLTHTQTHTLCVKHSSEGKQWGSDTVFFFSTAPSCTTRMTPQRPRPASSPALRPRLPHPARIMVRPAQLHPPASPQRRRGPRDHGARGRERCPRLLMHPSTWEQLLPPLVCEDSWHNFHRCHHMAGNISPFFPF